MNRSTLHRVRFALGALVAGACTTAAVREASQKYQSPAELGVESTPASAGAAPGSPTDEAAPELSAASAGQSPFGRNVLATQGPPASGPCNDGIDNDGDGYVDWTYDLGCASASDPDESADSQVREGGATTFEPPASGLVVYVSAAGSDAGPGTREAPLATVAAAFERIQDGQGAWILLRRGDRFAERIELTGVRGKSADDRVVVSSYGSSSEPPVITGGGVHAVKSLAHVALVGLSFLPEARDPARLPAEKVPRAGVRIVATGRDLLIENCRFAWAPTVIQSIDAPLEQVVIRRSAFTKAYETDRHASGIYASHVHGLVIEESVFDHNGWLERQRGQGSERAGGQATMFNHNLYLSRVRQLRLRNNLILRGASMGVKFRSDEPGAAGDLQVTDNLFYEGEIGVGLGGNSPGPGRFVGTRVEKNVFLHIGRSRPTNRQLAWGVDLAGNRDARIANNHFLHLRSTATGAPGSSNAHGIQLGGKGSSSVLVHENWFFDLDGPAIEILNGSVFSDVLITSSYFVGRGSPEAFMERPAKEGGTGITVRDQRVIAPGQQPGRWRDLATYAESLGGPRRAEAFIEAALGQTRWTWDPRLTATAVNDYLRGGFAAP